MSQNIQETPSEEVTQGQPEAPPEICPVGAQRMAKVPGRSVRNMQFMELGSAKMPKGNVRVFGHKKDGSILVIMPDQSGFLLDTNLVANQCYKYWLQTIPPIDEKAVSTKTV